MANDNPGLLSQYGLDLNTEDLRMQDLRRRQGIGLELADGIGLRGTTQRAGAQTGALLAAALQNRNYKPNEGEQARISVGEQTKKQMDQWLSANPEASGYDRATKYKELLAANAYRNGLPEIGTQILGELDASKRARQKQDLELRKLGVETKVAEATADDEIYKSAIESGQAAYMDAYLVGSRDPNATVSGIYDPKDHSLTLANGQKIPAGMWKTTRPSYDPRVGDGGRGGFGSRVGVDEQKKLRENAAAVMDLVDKVIAVDDHFNAIYERGGNVAGAMGTTGKVVAFVDRFVNTATDLARAMSPDGKTTGAITYKTKEGILGREKNYNLDSAADRAELARNQADRIKKYLPSDLALKAEDAERFRGMIVDLAYAQARAAEPGAKALTDADFEHALKSIGGHLNDPTTLRKMLFEKAFIASKSLENRFSLYTEDEMNEYLAPRGMKRYRDGMDTLTNRIGFDRQTGQAEGSSYPKGDRRGTYDTQPPNPNMPYGGPPADGGPPPGLTPEAFRAWKQAHPNWRPQ